MSDRDAALYIRTDGRRRFVGMAAAVGFVILWSSGTIFADLGLSSANALSFLALRLFLSAVIMWGICLGLRPKFPETFREWIHILLTGLLLQAAYQTFFFYSLELGISPGLLAIVLGVQPLVTAVITARHVRRVEWLGLVLGLVGLCVSVGDSVFEGRTTILGVLSAVASMLSMTVGTLLQKQTTASHPVSMAIQYTGSALVLVLLAWRIDRFAIHWTPSFIVALGWMVLVVSVGATMLLYSLLRQRSLTSVTSLFYCVPPVTAVLDYVIFGHLLPALAMLGMALVVAGLVLVNRQPSYVKGR